MALYGLVGGKKTALAASRLEKGDSTINITKKWNFVDELTHELNTSPPAIINDLKSIIVLDTAFKNTADVDKMARDFVILQDAFKSKGLSKVKLNLVTMIPDLLKKLEGSVEGFEGIYYSNVEVMLLKQKVNTQILVKIFKGGYDHTGLYNEKAIKQDLTTNLETSKRALVEDSKRISDADLKYGENVPVNEMNKEDYIDSDVTQKIIEQRQKDERRRQAQQKNEAKKKAKPNNSKVVNNQDSELTIPDLDDFADVEIDFETTPKVKEPKKKAPKRGNSFDDTDFVQTTGAPLGTVQADIRMNVGKDNAIPTVAEINELFRRLEKTDDDTLEQKLKSDNSVVTVVSPSGMGGSGFVAQSAEMYAMLGKKVLIIDLDIEKRSQTLYFPSYNDAVKEHKGFNNSLIKVSQGLDVKATAVPVTSRIDMLSISRSIENIDKDFSTTIAHIFQKIISDAKESYEIVLIDLPLRFLSYYLRNLGVVDRNVFVVDNKSYSVEDFFSIELDAILGGDDFFGVDFLKKSSLVLNKFEKSNRDGDGYQISKYKVKEKLIAAGDPYDNILVAGEIPLYKEWETQFITNVRYIWKDDLAIGIYRSIFSRIV